MGAGAPKDLILLFFYRSERGQVVSDKKSRVEEPSPRLVSFPDLSYRWCKLRAATKLNPFSVSARAVRLVDSCLSR